MSWKGSVQPCIIFQCIHLFMEWKEEHRHLLFTCLAKCIFSFCKQSYNVWKESQESHQCSFLVLGLLSEGVHICHMKMRTVTTSLYEQQLPLFLAWIPRIQETLEQAQGKWAKYSWFEVVIIIVRKQKSSGLALIFPVCRAGLKHLETFWQFRILWCFFSTMVSLLSFTFQRGT